MRLRLASAVALGVVISSALSGAPAASGATCAERVISDWRDGHIDGRYRPSCLRAALRNLPEDLRIYGTAEEDITRALNAAVVREQTPAKPNPSPRRVAAAAVATPSRAKDEGGLPVATIVGAAAAAVGAGAIAHSVGIATRRRRAS